MFENDDFSETEVITHRSIVKCKYREIEQKDIDGLDFPICHLCF